MTIGQILFYSGIGLLVLTIILAIFFIIRKPKYTPESAAYDSSGVGRTQNLLNGYPTDRMTIRRDSPQQVPLLRDSEETELMLDEATELMAELETPDSHPTEPMEYEE